MSALFASAPRLCVLGWRSSCRSLRLAVCPWLHPQAPPHVLPGSPCCNRKNGRQNRGRRNPHKGHSSLRHSIQHRAYGVLPVLQGLTDWVPSAGTAPPLPRSRRVLRWRASDHGCVTLPPESVLVCQRASCPLRKRHALTYHRHEQHPRRPPGNCRYSAHPFHAPARSPPPFRLEACGRG